MTKETKVEIVDFFGEGGAEWKMAATSMHDDVLLDPVALTPTLIDSLVGSPEST